MVRAQARRDGRGPRGERPGKLDVDTSDARLVVLGLVVKIQAGHIDARLVVSAGRVEAGRAPFARPCGPWLPGCILAGHPSRFVHGLDRRLCAVSLLAWVVLGCWACRERA